MNAVNNKTAKNENVNRVDIFKFENMTHSKVNDRKKLGLLFGKNNRFWHGSRQNGLARQLQYIQNQRPKFIVTH